MSERFEAWFKALEEGDGSLALPTPADRKQWDEYVARHALALGAWNAALNEVDPCILNLTRQLATLDAENKALTEENAALMASKQ
jgi:hypothetical protein